jgi:hypothetical protein
MRGWIQMLLLGSVIVTGSGSMATIISCHLCETINDCSGHFKTDTDTGKADGCDASCDGDCSLICEGAGSGSACKWTGEVDDSCSQSRYLEWTCGVAGTAPCSGTGLCDCDIGSATFPDPEIVCKVSKCLGSG